MAMKIEEVISKLCVVPNRVHVFRKIHIFHILQEIRLVNELAFTR